MKQFEVGHEYFDTWACDSDSISVIKIVKRSEKFVTFERDGKTRRAKIYTDSHGEYIMPDHYSMACVYRAERELQPENLDAEAIPDHNRPATPVVIGYTVSPDLLAFHFIGEITGKIAPKQSAFIAAVVKGSAGMAEA